MKIRIKGNSIRFRLTKSDLNRLVEELEIKEETCFPSGQKFSYGITAYEGSEIKADYLAGGIWLSIPKEKLLPWRDSEEVGFNQVYKDLSILIEKDFKCMTDREGEDESDHYPNPLAENVKS